MNPSPASQNHEPQRSKISDALWQPTDVVDFDLLCERAAENGHTGRLLALVRLHSRTAGMVELDVRPGEPLTAHSGRLRERFSTAIDRHSEKFGCSNTPVSAAADPLCQQRRASLLARAPSVSVVVATRDRPLVLRQCLDSLLAQRHSAREIIVVDNAPSSDATANLVSSDHYASQGVRYVREDIPGLGHAHNCGLAQASGEVVAVTDDDVLADPHWLAALLEAFVVHRPGCVTGLIVPIELRTREQSWVEQYGGFGRGYEQRTFSLDSPPSGEPLFPFTAGRFGSGANMAFDRLLLERLGGFDPALGAGTRARGGDDLAAFAATLLDGAKLVYQPDALIRHRHHDTLGALERMARGYGAGLTAYLTSLMVSRPHLVGQVVRRVPAGLRYVAASDSNKNNSKRADYPRRLVVQERIGMLEGPIGYWSSRRALRRRLATQDGPRLAAPRQLGARR